MASGLSVLACIVAVSALLWAEFHNSAALRRVAKPIASAAFIALALSCGATQTEYGLLVLTALIFCFFGDVLLIPAADRYFLAGMAAFAAGHLAYLGAFLSHSPANSGLFLIIAALMAACALLAMRWLWPHLGKLRWPVAAYAAVITLMVATSVMAAPPDRLTPSILVIVGAVWFAASDLAVARDRFIVREFFNKAWGLPLYYGAQMALAASV